MLNHINVPDGISQYVSHAYSQLKAFVSSAHWSTKQFQIEREVFQGDTLSPLIFLVTFNPIIALANSKLESGYSLHYPVPSSVSLPPVGAHIYIEWNEPTSNEPPGWYHCSVSSYTLSGQSIITYPNSNTETINLNSVTWHLATGNSRYFLPFHHAPPNVKVPKIRKKLESQKYCSTAPHCVKAYCDDLTLFSTSKCEHQTALMEIDENCQDLSLHLKPLKCVSLVFDGNNSIPNVTFPLSSGSTTNIQRKPTKFLRKTLAHCPTSTGKETSTHLKEILLPQLSAIDACSVIGECKTWMLNYIVLPSLHFYLMVNDIPKSRINAAQKEITKMIKKWLHLPPCTTISTLFHPGGLNLKFLLKYCEEAKLALISTINRSIDSPVLDCIPTLTSPTFLDASNIPYKIWQVFKEATDCCLVEHSAPKPNKEVAKCKEAINEHYIHELEAHLRTLTVQDNLLDILLLGKDDHLWQCLLTGMPAGQFSFVLLASSDCLPSPNTLVRWGYSLCKKCPLCNSSTCNAHHILSGCPTALQDGRYTWCHDRVLSKLAHFIRESNPAAKVFADLPDQRACKAPVSTVPTDLTITTTRPDIVLIEGKLSPFLSSLCPEILLVV